MEKLYKYTEDFGELGILTGIFLLDQKIFDLGMGMGEACLGVILGESETYATLNDNTIKELTDDQYFISRALEYGIIPIGINPFKNLV